MKLSNVNFAVLGTFLAVSCPTESQSTFLNLLDQLATLLS